MAQNEHKARVQAHYDSHVKGLSTAEALKARREGPAAPLKEFHNEIKRRLIYRFAYRADSLLDYACGRGGDLHKWRAAQISYVKGIDLSKAEVEEAQRRFEEVARKDRGMKLRCDFEQCEHLGDRSMPEFEPFDAVTCMFAIHYFFAKEEMLATLLANAAGSLKDGGYFIGTVPDGKRIMAHLAATGSLDEPLLRLVKKWEGGPKKYGSAYTMEIKDTVVEGVEGASEGSDEFLVFSSALTKAAAAHGLHPVCDYQDPEILKLFEEADAVAPFKHFRPQFPEATDKSLALASQLYMAFVFQKVKSPEAARAPPLPPPEPRRGGPGGGGRFAQPQQQPYGQQQQQPYSQQQQQPYGQQQQPYGQQQQQQGHAANGQQQQQRGGGYGGGGGSYRGGRQELPVDQHPRFQPGYVQQRAAYSPALPQAYAYTAAKQGHVRGRQGRFVFAPAPPQWVPGVPVELQRRYGYYDYRGQQELMRSQQADQEAQQAAAAAGGHGGSGGGGYGYGAAPAAPPPPPAAAHAGAKRHADGTAAGARPSDPVGYGLGAAGDGGGDLDAGGRQLLVYDDDILDGPGGGVPGAPAAPQYAPDDDD